jgi:hypothetical protein
MEGYLIVVEGTCVRCIWLQRATKEAGQVRVQGLISLCLAKERVEKEGKYSVRRK